MHLCGLKVFCDSHKFDIGLVFKGGVDRSLIMSAARACCVGGLVKKVKKI